VDADYIASHNDEQDRVRTAVRSYMQSKSEIARREADRHNRRLRELTGEQQKPVQLYYKGGVSEEVLQAEQARIETERGQAKQWADAADREVEDVMAALDDALLLLDATTIIYEALPVSVRRLVNQAVFLALTVRDPDTIEATRTPLYEALHQFAQAPSRPRKRPQPATTGPGRPGTTAHAPKTTPTPIFGAGVRT